MRLKSKSPVPRSKTPTARNGAQTFTNFTKTNPELIYSFQCNQPSTPKLVVLDVLMERLKHYQELEASKEFRSLKQIVHKNSNIVREKPIINQRSQELYARRAKERNLSPSVLVRLQTDTSQREKRLAKNQVYLNKTATLRNKF